MSKEQTPEEDPYRVPHLLLFILAGTNLLRTEVLDRDIIDRQEIVHIADNIEKHVMELSHHVLGADISEWQAEQEKKREQS